jgi:hypothetical protein
MDSDTGKTISTPIEIQDHGDTAIETGSWATTQADGPAQRTKCFRPKVSTALVTGRI